MMEKRDAEGTVLRVGDTIVWASSRGSTVHPHIGVIENITEKAIVVHITRSGRRGRMNGHIAWRRDRFPLTNWNKTLRVATPTSGDSE